MDYEKEYKKLVGKIENAYLYAQTDSTKAMLEEIRPELKDSGDENIRKHLLYHFRNKTKKEWNGMPVKDILVWLEKQGEYDKIVEKAKSEKQRVLLTETNGNAGIDWDTRSLADTKTLLEYGLDFINKKLEKQGKPKHTDKVEPKFRIGDIIRHKKHGFTCKIIAIDTEYRLSGCMGTHLPFDSQDAYELVESKLEIKYIYTNFRVGDVIVEIKPNGYCQPVRVKYIDEGAYLCESDDGTRSLSFPIIRQDEYKLVEQKPAWSEEDEKKLNYLIALLYNSTMTNAALSATNEGLEDWLKSIKDRYTWKPTGEQMKFLWKYAEQNNYDGRILTSLFNDLKKLKGV